MPPVIFRFIGTQDTPEGGEPIGVVDLGDRTIQVATKQSIKHIAAAYTFVAEDSGTLFIFDAAATLTLPASSAAFKGCWLEFVVGADVTTVVGATAGELVTFNDIAANSITFSTSSEKVGAAGKVVNDGTKWYLMLMTEETQTMTVTT